MLELVIVRHAESVRNHAVDLAHQGDCSLLEYQIRFERDEATWDLTQRGIDQSRSAGAWIRENISGTFKMAAVSSFKRAQQTAANLNIQADRWIVDERLRERDWGDYEAPGFPPYTVEQYLTDLSFCSKLFWKCDFPGAESIADMLPRCDMFLREMVFPEPSGKILLVSHGGTIKSLQLLLERVGLEQAERLTLRHLNNCSVLHYRLEDIDLEHGIWNGSVRFASPTLLDQPVSPWEPIAACTP